MSARPMVLLVDDAVAILQVVSDLLRCEGYEVVTAADGEAALLAARARKPDAVVLDVVLPRLSGPEVMEVMRQDATLREVPVVLMTAIPWSVSTTDPPSCAVIHKPFVVDRLLEALSNMLVRVPD